MSRNEDGPLHDLSIVVVTWNTCAVTLECLSSIYSSSVREIIVVDNGSQDGTAAAIAQRFPAVVLIRNPDNRGYAIANNQGVKVSTGKYVLLLNSDTRPDIASIRILLDHLVNDPTLGAVGPQLFQPDGTLQSSAAGGRLTLGSALANNLLLSSLMPSVFSGYSLPQRRYVNSPPVAVGWVSGAAMMTRREVFEAVGGLPEHQFMYAEDVEFCENVTAAGYRVEYVPAARIEHLNGYSSSRSGEINTRWLTATFAYYRRTRPHGSTRALAGTFALGALVQLALSPLSAISSLEFMRERMRRNLSYLLVSMKAMISG